MGINTHMGGEPIPPGCPSSHKLSRKEEDKNEFDHRHWFTLYVRVSHCRTTKPLCIGPFRLELRLFDDGIMTNIKCISFYLDNINPPPPSHIHMASPFHPDTLTPSPPRSGIVSSPALGCGSCTSTRTQSGCRRDHLSHSI